MRGALLSTSAPPCRHWHHGGMTDAPQTAREVARAELTAAILDRARTQLSQVGPAALSVRAVARDLGMVSSAVYRYFATRDALLTGLIVEAYDDLGAAVEAADAAVRRGDLRKRFRAVAGALRDWALAHPHEYALCYGAPVPGYAGSEETTAPAARVTLTLLALVGDAELAGRRGGPARVAAAEKASVKPVSESVEPALSPASTVRALAVWAALVGQVSLEVFGQLEGSVLDADAHFAAVVDLLAADLDLA